MTGPIPTQAGRTSTPGQGTVAGQSLTTVPIHVPRAITPATVATNSKPRLTLGQMQQQQRVFLASNIRLSNGDYVSKASYDALSPADQARLMQLGVAKFNAQLGASGASGITNAAAYQAYYAQVKAYFASDSVITAQHRISDLLQEASNADQLAIDGTLNGVYMGSDPAHHSVSPDQKAAYQAEAAKARATANLLQSYINAQAPITPQLSSLSDPKILPFVTVNPDGSFNIDTVGAAKLGVDTTLLKAVGATDADIAQGQAQAKLIKYAVIGGGFDLSRAVSDNVDISTLKTLGFTDAAISQAQTYNAAVNALKSGKITPAQAQLLGITTSNASTTSAPDYDSWATKLLPYEQAIYRKAGGGQLGYNAVIQDGYDTWANNLANTYLQDIYKAKGGGEAGYNAVMSQQQQAIAVLAAIPGAIDTDGYYHFDVISKAGQTMQLYSLFTPQQIARGFGQPTNLSPYKQSPVETTVAGLKSVIPASVNNPQFITNMLAKQNMSYIENLIQPTKLTLGAVGIGDENIQRLWVKGQIETVTGQKIGNKASDLQAAWQSLSQDQKNQIASGVKVDQNGNITTVGLPTAFQLNNQTIANAPRTFSTWVSQHTTGADQTTLTSLAAMLSSVAIGMTVGALGSTIQLITNPREIPQAIPGMVNSTITAFNGLRAAVAGGDVSPTDIGLNIGSLTSSAIMVVGAAEVPYRMGYTMTTFIAPQGIWNRSMGILGNTDRMPIDIEGVSNVDLMRAYTEVMRQSMTVGDYDVAEVPIGNSGLSIRLIKTPLQQMIGDVVFSGTNEGIEGSRAFTNVYQLNLRSGDAIVSVQLPKGMDMSNIRAAITEIGKFNVQDVAGLDAPQVRPFSVADAAITRGGDIPDILTGSIQQVISKYDGTVYGSFVDWVKRLDAAQPHDVDVVFDNIKAAESARAEIADAAEQASYTTRTSDRGVQIQGKNGEWTTIFNAVDADSHASMLKGIFEPQTAVTTEGVRMDTLGSQIVNQTLGALKDEPKAIVRAGKVADLLPTITEVGEAKGVIPDTAYDPLTGQMIVNANGMYTNTWAAFDYTRGGDKYAFEIKDENGIMGVKNVLGSSQAKALATLKAAFVRDGVNLDDIEIHSLGLASRGKPGFMMIITDKSLIKDAPETVTANPTQSDAFIRGADPGLWGQSKVWLRNAETELVYGPGSGATLLAPTADLITRILVGKNADFFTSAGGEFIPIRLAFDKGLIDAGRIDMIPTPSDLYAIKLRVLQTTIRDITEAVTHPGRSLSDIIHRLNFGVSDRPYGEGSYRGPIGVREVELKAVDGTAISKLSAEISNAAMDAARAEAEAGKIDVNSIAFADLYNSHLQREYDQLARTMLNQNPTITNLYTTDPNTRGLFEQAYITNLTSSMQALVSTRAVIGDTIRVAQNLTITAPESLRTVSAPSTPISTSTPITTVSVVSAPLSTPASAPISTPASAPISTPSSAPISSPTSTLSQLSGSSVSSEERTIENRRIEERIEDRGVETRGVEDRGRIETEIRSPSEETRAPEEGGPRPETREPYEESRVPPPEIREPREESRIPPPGPRELRGETRTPPPGTPRFSGPRDNSDSSNPTSLQKAFSGGVAWKQGIVYWVGKAPYRTINDWHAFSPRNLPPGVKIVKGGPKSAYKSIQAMGYEVPDNLILRLGFERIAINSPEINPGKTGAIGFKNAVGKPLNADVRLRYRVKGVDEEDMSSFLWGTPPIKKVKVRRHRRARQVTETTVNLREMRV